MNQIAALLLVAAGGVAFVAYSILYRNRAPNTRAFPVFRALSDEVGRVAEEGALIHVALGSGSLVGEDAMTSVAALQGLNGLLDLAAAYDTPPLITTGDPLLYLMAGHWMRRAYARLGNTALFRSNYVEFTAASPVTYAAMAATHLKDDRIGANVLLGTYDQEISLLGETAQRRGIHSVGGAVSVYGLAALYPLLGQDNLIMGEELFAGGNEVTPRAMFWSSLLAQDILRFVVIAGIVGTALFSLLGMGD